MYRITGREGITVLNMHSSTALSFFSLLFTFGVESGKFGWAWGEVGWEGCGLLNSKCHNARTSSIYCFRDCLLYLVCVSFFFLSEYIVQIFFLKVSNYTNDPFLQGCFKKANLFVIFPLRKTWIPLSVLCRSHQQMYAQLHFKKCVYKPFYRKKKRRKENLKHETVGTACSVVGKVSDALLFYCTVTSLGL